MMTNTATFKIRIHSKANDAFGAVDYTITETLTEVDGGLMVETAAVGVCEGDSVNDRSSKFWPGVSMEKARGYRLSHGYYEAK